MQGWGEEDIFSSRNASHYLEQRVRTARRI